VWGKLTVVVVADILPVHPHVCGENLASALIPQLTRGSPPRVWGKWFAHSALRLVGLVHPHVCGENSGTSSLSER